MVTTALDFGRPPARAVQQAVGEELTDAPERLIGVYMRRMRLALEALLNSRAHVHAYPHMTMRLRMRIDTGSSSERIEHSREGDPCSLCPRRCETSGDPHKTMPESPSHTLY